jgi:hypothetical protein
MNVTVPVILLPSVGCRTATAFNGADACFSVDWPRLAAVKKTAQVSTKPQIGIGDLIFVFGVSAANVRHVPKSVRELSHHKSQ